MIWQTNPVKRQKQITETNINALKDNKLNVVDAIFVGEIDRSNYYIIEEIIYKKDSSMSDMDYYVTRTSYINVGY